MYEIRESESSGLPITNVVRVDSDATEVFIPVDESNSDYQAYLAWVAEGNEAVIEDAN